MVWRLGVHHTILKGSVRQNDNPNYIDGSINEVTFKGPDVFAVCHPLVKWAKPFEDLSGTTNES